MLSRLFTQHIAASMAYARMLGKQDILSSQKTATLLAGLAEILAAPPDLSTHASHADVHAVVDTALEERLGSAGEKLSALRTRHDQAATDLRLWTREEIVAECQAIALLPGYADLQRIHPVLLGHHLLAYHEMLYRDSFRLRETYVRSDILPLGAGALAGPPYPLDRAYAAALLGMHAVTRNSLDAVGDRDFLIEHLSQLAILAMHVSPLAQDLVLWSTAEFDFVGLECGPATAAILRANTGRVYSAQANALTIMKGLSLGYHADLQEHNEPYFAAADTLRAGLAVALDLLEGAQWHTERMRLATEASWPGTDGLTAAEMAAAQEVRGGTAPSRVAVAVADGYTKIEFLEHWVAERRSQLPTVEKLLEMTEQTA